jgi:hypothetical protein
MLDALVVAGSSLASAVVTGVAGYFVGQQNARRALAAEYEGALRERRIRTYPAGWQITAPLAYEADAGAIDAASYNAIGRDLLAWYFQEAGLYMTWYTQNSYVRLIEACEAVTPENLAAASAAARKRASEFRTDAARDIQARRPSWLGRAGMADPRHRHRSERR